MPDLIYIVDTYPASLAPHLYIRSMLLTLDDLGRPVVEVDIIGSRNSVLYEGHEGERDRQGP